MNPKTHLRQNQYRTQPGMTGVDPRHPVMQSDTVPAMLTPGEAVLNPVATQVAGPSKIDALNKATAPMLPLASKTPAGFGMGGRVVRGYAGGGIADTLGRMTGGLIGTSKNVLATKDRMAQLQSGAELADAPAATPAPTPEPTVPAQAEGGIPGAVNAIQQRHEMLHGYGMGGMVQGFAGGRIVPSEEFVDPRATPWIRRGAFNPSAAEAAPPPAPNAGFVDPRVPPNSSVARAAPPGGVPNMQQPLTERVGNAVSNLRQGASKVASGVLPAARAALPQLGAAGIMAGVSDQVRADAGTPEKQAEFHQFMDKIPGQGQTLFGLKLFDKPEAPAPAAPQAEAPKPAERTPGAPSPNLGMGPKPKLPNSSTPELPSSPTAGPTAQPHTVANETKGGGVEWGDNYIRPGSGYNPNALINDDGTGVFGGVDPARTYGMGMRSVREGLADPNRFTAADGSETTGGEGRGTVSVIANDQTFDTASKEAKHSAGMARLRAGGSYEEQPYDPSADVLNQGMALARRHGEIGDMKRRQQGVEMINSALGMRAKAADNATQMRGQDLQFQASMANAAARGMGGSRGRGNPAQDLESSIVGGMPPEQQQQWALGKAGIHPNAKEPFRRETADVMRYTKPDGTQADETIPGIFDESLGAYIVNPSQSARIAQIAAASAQEFDDGSWGWTSDQSKQDRANRAYNAQVSKYVDAKGRPWPKVDGVNTRINIATGELERLDALTGGWAPLMATPAR